MGGDGDAAEARDLDATVAAGEAQVRGADVSDDEQRDVRGADRGVDETGDGVG